MTIHMFIFGLTLCGLRSCALFESHDAYHIDAAAKSLKDEPPDLEHTTCAECMTRLVLPHDSRMVTYGDGVYRLARIQQEVA